MSQAVAPILSGTDRLGAVYQLKIHLLGILSAESMHILDWFHLTMRLTVLQEYALGFAQVDTAGEKGCRTA